MEMPQMPEDPKDRRYNKARLERFGEIIAKVVETIDLCRIDEQFSEDPTVIPLLRTYTEQLAAS